MNTKINAETSYSQIYPESWERLQEVNRISEQLQSYWVGFLTICAFILASAMSVTHRDIFLAEPMQLPVISVELPIGWFFAASPILILLLHIFLLVKYRSLLDSLVWLRTLEKTKPRQRNVHTEEIEEHLKNTILMRSLAINERGASRNAVGENRFSKFFSPILNATLMLLPIILFLILQGKILPYQHTYLEYEYRFLILAEVIVVFWAFSEYWKDAGKGLWLMIVAAIVSLSISFVFMTSSPKYIASGYWDRWQFILPWSPILNPGNRDFVNDEQFRNDEGQGTKFLTNRSFVGANLDYADLRNINLYGSDFRYSNLLRARLENAVLKETDFSGAYLRRASFQRAALDDSRFWGANLQDADFSGADLKRGEFHGANLEGGIFDGSNIKTAKIIGANLRHARFTGANLKNTTFTGSYLGQTSFLGAELKNTKFQNSIFNGQEFLESLTATGCNIVTHPDECTQSEEDIILRFSAYEIEKVVPIDGIRTALFIKDKKGSKSLFLVYQPDFSSRNFKFFPNSIERIQEEIRAENIKNEDIKDKFDAVFVREVSKTNLYCNGNQYHGNFLHYVFDVIKDQNPNFKTSNLKDAVFQENHLESVSESTDIPLFWKSEPEEVPQNLSRPSKFWSDERREQSDAHKLELFGCRETIASRILEKEDLIKFNSMINLEENLEKVMCRAGIYPHVANTIVMSGRLGVQTRKEMSEFEINAANEYIPLARKMLKNRCDSSCPGAEDMHARAISRLWNIAVQRNIYDSRKQNKKASEIWKFSSSLPFGNNGVPEIVGNCEKWDAFLNQNPMSEQNN